jgi:hypothetical protein
MTELSDKLTERGISHVYFIDDENAQPTLATIDHVVDAFVKAPLKVLQAFAAKDARIAPAVELLSEMEGADSGQKRDAVGGLLQGIVETHRFGQRDYENIAATLLPARAETQIVRRLRGVFPRALTPLSFADWQQRCDQILAGATDGARLLLLVDEFNTNEPNVDLSGKSLIANLWRRHPTRLPLVDVVVLTSNCTAAGEFEEAAALLGAVRQELGDPAVERHVYRAFVLAKERININPLDAQFVVHLNRIAAAQLRGDLVSRTISVLRSAIDASEIWLEQIPLTAFYGSVFLSSSAEGAAEIDTLLRLASLKQRLDLEKTLVSDMELRQTVSKMREFSLRKLDAELSASSQADLRSLRKKEFERDSSHVNALLAPIACGDVFSLRLGDHQCVAMLLANPCDLTLRKSGKRKLARGWLVRVSVTTRAEVQESRESDNRMPPLRYSLHTGQSPADVCYQFDNSNVESIDLSILDLCSTNIDGNAVLSPQTAGSSHAFVLPPLRKCIERLAMRSREALFKPVEIWGKSLTPNIQVADAGTIGTVEVKTTVSYDVSRIWRLSPEYAAAALTALSHSISRPAFDHDFMRVD